MGLFLSSTELASSGTTGVCKAMNVNSATNTKEGLALRYSKLWHTDLSVPDVFAFLSSCPEVSDTERLSVLLVDQHERWQRGRSLPLRVYLTAFPDIAARGEMVRALVDGERQERRKSSGRLNATIDVQGGDMVSEAPTHPVEVESLPEDTQADKETWVQDEPTTRPFVVPESDVNSTKSRSTVTRTEEPLPFSVDESYRFNRKLRAFGRC